MELLECVWLNRAERGVVEKAGKYLLFLHEGLGCAGMWQDFPRQLCFQTQLPALIYSRHGYGNSSLGYGLLNPEDCLPFDYLEEQGRRFLPEFLRSQAVDRPVWLVGHSDGATIALYYAMIAGDAVAGVVAIAPHVFVEEQTLVSIGKLLLHPPEGHWHQKMAKWHKNWQIIFPAWHGMWLSDDFRHWNMESGLEAITCPVLLIQGEHDQYGSQQQIEAVTQRVPQAQVFMLPDSRHHPHFEQRHQVLERVASFIRSVQ
ncbi:MAG: alpha/beta hydrolase [Gammaproteobacteria bacterium]|nr:alpha/beta hydrolase [Gammaproteobacteria bacterium]